MVSLSHKADLFAPAAGIRIEQGEVMMIAALALSILVGVSLGMLGGGGSILTVPILTYVAGVSTKSAIASSLFVVGVTSAVASIAHARAGRVRWRTGLTFGAAGMAGAYAGGRLAAFMSPRTLMVLFALMMLATAVAMLRKPRPSTPRAGELPTLTVVAEGVVVGVVTGVVGAGGGFLVVPALVLLGGLPMPIAIGTSLVVIAMKSFAGVAGHLGHVAIDWPITLGVTASAVVGSLIGSRLMSRVSAQALRRGFGLLIISIATLVLAKELF